MEEFLAFAADILGVEVNELDADTAYGVHPKWDSLMHLRLIMETEERYDTEIPIDEVPEIKTLQDLYRYVTDGEAAS